MMGIQPDLKTVHKKRHDDPWPDMAQAISESGIRTYSIYFPAADFFFDYLESEDQARSPREAGTEMNVRYKSRLNGSSLKKDRSTVGPDIEMVEEVFHLD